MFTRNGLGAEAALCANRVGCGNNGDPSAARNIEFMVRREGSRANFVYMLDMVLPRSRYQLELVASL
jgi:hypothetical protein